MRRSNLLMALIIFAVTLLIYVPVLGDYGLTWDFHYHFFGGARILGMSWRQIEPRSLPYSPPDPRDNTDLPYGPLMSVVPVVSYLFFHVYTGLLPDDIAYNLSSTIIGSLGPVILYLFLVEATKRRRLALIAAAFLTLTPRYFGDLHNNMKDIPMAVVFALNVWLIWRLVSYRRIRDLILAAAGFAVAFNIKINSIFIPALMFTWLASLFVVKRRKFRLSLLRQKSVLTVLAFFILAPVFALALWSLFWADPIGKIQQMSINFGVGTNNIEVLFNGHTFSSGYNVPWYYSWGYLAITTPLPILLLFGLGAIVLLWRYAHRRDTTGILVLLWLVVPLIGYFWPKIGVIDGIRHFEEVVFPIAATAAVGADKLLVWLNQLSRRRPGARSILQIGVIISVFVYLIRAVVIYHPYQVTYFNELVGGLKGAMGKYDLDYWGTSQKKAIQWLNQHAPPNAHISIVMAADVASRYLRPDLLTNVNTNAVPPDYVVVLNRQSFFYRYWVVDYILRHTPVYAVSSQGVPLTWIYDNHQPEGPLQPKWWHEDSP